MFGYWIAGLWTHAVTYYYLICLPLTLAGVALGRAINHRLRAQRSDGSTKVIGFALNPPVFCKASLAILRESRMTAIHLRDPWIMLFLLRTHKHDGATKR
jgi:hypothetical protein